MTTPSSHCIIVPRRGEAELMEWTECDLPEPAPGEVRVRVEAAGVSAYDAMMRRHWFPGSPALPYTLGEDVIGIVDRLGDGVERLNPGQRVGGWTFGEAGGYAEHLCRPAADFVPVPAALDPEIAVALITNYLTAHLALHQASKVAKGESLLVLGAGGGLGSALLQLAREAGVEAYGSDVAEKHDAIREDGAEPIDHRTENVAARTRELTGQGADIAIDLVGGGRQLLRSWKALNPEGRLLMLGMAGTFASGTAIILPSLIMVGTLALWPGKRRVVNGPGMENYPRAHPDWYQKTLTDMFEMAVQGRLQPRIAHRIPMENAGKAHALIESGHVSGKIVLTT